MEVGTQCRLAVVIVAYNSEADIERCVRSAASFCSESDRIIVVDNTSIDNTRDILKRLDQEIEYLQVVLLDENLGFGTANNIGFSQIVAEWYFLLNVDAWLHQDSVNEAIALLEKDSHIAVCGLPLIFPDGRPQTYAYPFSSWQKWFLQIIGIRKLVQFFLKINLVKYLLLQMPMAKNYVVSQQRQNIDLTMNYSPSHAVEDVDWVCGAAMLLKGDFIQDTKGFDSKIFLYGEDEDLCITAHRKGKRVVTCDVFPVVHVFGWGKNSFNPMIARYKYDSLIYFIDKNISNKFNRAMMRMLLPVHVYGWSFMSIPMETLDRLKNMLDKVDVISDIHGVESLTSEIFSRKGITTLGFVNAHAFNIAARDSTAYRDFLNLDFILRDGIGVELKMKLLGRTPGNNMNGTDYIPNLIQEAVKQDFDILLLGTEQPYNEFAAHRIRDDGGNVLVVEDGFHEVSYYVDLVTNNVRKDSLVILAMGMPKQERVAAAIRNKSAEVDSRVIIVCGGAILDFMGGKVQRAPNWVRRVNVEWAYRLLREPRRLFHRYVVGNVVFLSRAMMMAIKSKC